MPDKLTDNEIVKALEICGTYKGKCTDCPAFVKVDRSNCKQVLLGAIKIINRQKAENEQKDKNYIELLKTSSERAVIIGEQDAEIERLKDALTDHEYANCVAIKNGLIYTHTLEDYDRLIGDISAEARKEFAERVKNIAVQYCREIDNLLKETESEEIEPE